MERNELQKYFKERVLELLHYETIDTYRVRSHNSYTLLVELKELITGWIKNNIKLFETIALCIEEVLDAIKKDTCLDFAFYNKESFISDIGDYSKTKGENTSESRKILMTINRCIDYNEHLYLPKLLDSIELRIFGEEIIQEKDFSPEIELLDYEISALCCALLHIGYSKQHLYTAFNGMFKMSDFRKAYNKLKEEYSTPKLKNYTVVLKLSSIPQYIINADIPELYSSYDFDCGNNTMVKGYLNLKEHEKLFVVPDCKAMDTQSATKRAIGCLNTYLDSLQLVVNNLKLDLPKKALVILGSYAHLSSTDYKFDGVYSNDISLATSFKEYLEKIWNNQFIEQGVKDRIDSALRHLRVGNSSEELEQRFINYWIALEFLFSSPESAETTFNRIKKFLPTILTSCYVKRNLYALNQCLIKSDLLTSGDLYWEKEDVDQYINTINSIMLRYKLKLMKSRIFTTSDKREDYINSHEKNLKWHIARIYRVRNELIHEAALTQEIEGITSNLRYYLVFVLNQIIVFFANANKNRNLSIEDFYHEYVMIKTKIKKELNIKTLLEVPLELDLLK